jgi:transposase-like protein
MTLTQSDVTELLDAIRAGGDIDVIRKGVELVLQALIEAEASEAIGAGRYERTESRTNQRNGLRDRLLATKAGDVDLKIPKLRKGTFFPSILERRRRIDRALFAVVMEAYVHGVSTRKVDDLVSALGAASGISKSEVSRICAGLDARWRPSAPAPSATSSSPTSSPTPPCGTRRHTTGWDGRTHLRPVAAGR